MSDLTVTIGEHTYEAELCRAPNEGSPVVVTIYRDDAFSGRGVLGKSMRIEDCVANLGEDVYEALEAEIKDAMRRGLYSEMDPTGEDA